MKISAHSKILALSTAGSALIIAFGYLINSFQSEKIISVGSSKLLAQTYVPLSGDTTLFPPNTINLDAFIQNLFQWGVVIVLVLAVLYMVFGGIEYMTSDAVFQKDDGKKKMTAALAGLILALVSWLILKTINPELLETDPTRNATGVQGESAAPPTSGNTSSLTSGSVSGNGNAGTSITNAPGGASNTVSFDPNAPATASGNLPGGASALNDAASSENNPFPNTNYTGTGGQQPNTSSGSSPWAIAPQGGNIPSSNTTITWRAP